MHEPRDIMADNFRQMGQEGDDVVLGDGFDLVDASDVELDVLGFPDGLRVFPWDHAQSGLRVAGMGLDLVPNAELGLGGPDGDHFGAGIARDHVRSFDLARALHGCARDKPRVARVQGQLAFRMGNWSDIKMSGQYNICWDCDANIVT